MGYGPMGTTKRVLYREVKLNLCVLYSGSSLRKNIIINFVDASLNALSLVDLYHFIFILSEPEL